LRLVADLEDEKHALEARCAEISKLLEDGMNFVEVGADVAGTGLSPSMSSSAE
jgi:hypothetical protein